MSDYAVKDKYYTYMLNDNHVLYKVYPNDNNDWTQPINLPNDTLAIRDDVFMGKPIVDVYLPDDLTAFYKGTFKNCTKLETINMPSYLETIGPDAFWGCTKMHINLELPACCTDIGSEAFKYAGIKNITGIGHLEVIQMETFFGCKELIRADLRYSGLKQIRLGAFCSCEKLKELWLPDTLDLISTSAFCKCSSLEYVKIPASVTKIDTYAFGDCDNLEVVEFMSDKQTALLDEVDKIFQRCRNLTRIIFPSIVFDKESATNKWYAYTRNVQEDAE